MAGLGLTDTPQIEVLATYAAPEDAIPAVATAPGWYAKGAFNMPVEAAVRVEIFGAVSDGSLTMSGRLFNIKEGSVGPVSGSVVSITSTTDVRRLSGFFTLPVGFYQMQVQVVGDEGEEFFGSLKAMTVIS